MRRGSSGKVGYFIHFFRVDMALYSDSLKILDKSRKTVLGDQ